MVKKLILTTLCIIVSTSAQAQSLYEVYVEALHNDPTYLSAVSQYESDSELLPQAWSVILPTLGLTGTTSINKTTLHGNQISSSQTETTTSNRGYQAAVEIDQILFDAGAFGGITFAKKSVQASAATKAAALQDLMIRVSNAYFNVLQTEEEMRYAKLRKTSLARSLDQAQQKYNVGLNTITDVNLAQANYSAAEALLESSKNNIATAKEDLRAITGQYYDDLAPLKDDFALIAPEPLDPEKWVDVALNRNWTLKAANLTSQAAQKNISITRSGHYPTLGAALDYSNTFNRNSQTGASRTYQPQAALSLNVPIFQGGRVVSETRQAIADYEVADMSQEFTRRSIINSTRSNYLGVISIIAQIKADKTAITASESALEGMNTGYRLGTQTLVDVLSAQDTLFDNQTTYATDRYNYLLTTLALKQAAGTLQAKDLLNINAWLDLNAKADATTSRTPQKT